MGFFDQVELGRGRSIAAAVWVGLFCVGTAGAGRVKSDPWASAVKARVGFEAEAKGSHTRVEYARVMDGFRAIYHGDPGDVHAAKAVAQVAELLAEQGREFGDRKSLHDAAGQYEFLAKAYPDAELAPVALGQALDLLGAGDSAEAAKVRGELENDYPRSGAAKAARSSESVGGVRAAGKRKSSAERAEVVPPTSESPDMGHAVVAGVQDAGPVAVVSGIRHWSTANYTRVAIDLGADVKYEAARVENPDRIFFDLHHARLGPQLEGKSFSVTDDGFLTKIRAAQFSDDVTRVVLDVHQVTEYSAFLLPNPYRLIIDIHGKRSGEASGSGAQGPESAGAVAAPVVRSAGAESAGGVEVSSLPPMPVTDGGGAFGLPAKGGVGAAAQPRVVVSTKPTVDKPVPNTVVTHSSETGSEVAAVSRQPGEVKATRKPTSGPVVVKSKGAGSRAQGSGDAEGQGSRAKGLEDEKSADSDDVPVVVAEGSKKSKGGKAAPVVAAAPTADGETLMRALGLKIGRIVIDAGHGGHDSGTLGVGGIEEKDVVLDVALRLGKMLHDRLGAEIVYTRANDTFVPLETRTAIANKAQADLFISIHANSSPDASARGVEVYYLNFTSDPDAMRVAARENAVSTKSVYELSDLVKKIALKDKIDESKELAADVDGSLYGGLEAGNDGLKDRGVKKAPFVVLIGANMPSILAEISFVTNPDDAEQLKTKAYRQRVAESLYAGIARYAQGINGGKAAGTQRAAR